MIMTKYENSEYDYNSLKNRFTTGDWEVAAERNNTTANQDEKEEDALLEAISEEDEAIKAGKEAIMKEEKMSKKAIFDLEYDQEGGGKAVAEAEDVKMSIQDLYKYGNYF